MDTGFIAYWLKNYRACIDIASDRAFWASETAGDPWRMSWEEWVAWWLEGADAAEAEVVSELVKG